MDDIDEVLLGPSSPRPTSPRSEHAVEEPRPTRLYIGNLAFAVTETDLIDHFKPLGATEASIISDHDRRSKGCGLVSFETPQLAQEAIDSMNNVEFMGRKMFVREDREKKQSSGSGRAGGAHRSKSPQNHSSKFRNETKLYVGNLPFAMSWQDLKDRFRERVGETTYCDVRMNEEGRSKGYGFICFARDDDAERAIDLFDGVEWEGRRIVVRHDRPRGGEAPAPRDRHRESDRDRDRERDRGGRGRERERRRERSRSRSRGRSYSPQQRSRSRSRSRSYRRVEREYRDDHRSSRREEYGDRYDQRMFAPPPSMYGFYPPPAEAYYPAYGVPIYEGMGLPPKHDYHDYEMESQRRAERGGDDQFEKRRNARVDSPSPARG